MRYISSKINIHIRSVSIINNNIERLILPVVFWSFGALAILYVLLLGNMVMNIIERRSLEVSARDLSNEVGDLELTYLSLSNKVDLVLANSLGFKETKTTFVTRKSLGYGPASEAIGLRSVSESPGNIKKRQNDI